jgi:hypothetical protein
VAVERSIEPVKEVPVDIESLMKKAAAGQKENFLREILKENDAYRERFRTLVLGNKDNWLQIAEKNVKSNPALF